MNIGDKVRYIGTTDEEVRWGGNDDPRDVLTKGEIYTINSIEVHSWHTKISLQRVEGQFNSVCFDEMEEN